MSAQRVRQLKLSWFAARLIQNASLISRMLAHLKLIQPQLRHTSRWPSIFLLFISPLFWYWLPWWVGFFDWCFLYICLPFFWCYCMEDNTSIHSRLRARFLRGLHRGSVWCVRVQIWGRGHRANPRICLRPMSQLFKLPPLVPAIIVSCNCLAPFLSTTYFGFI